MEQWGNEEWKKARGGQGGMRASVFVRFWRVVFPLQTTLLDRETGMLVGQTVGFVLTPSAISPF